jgi:hypothetical protein
MSEVGSEPTTAASALPAAVTRSSLNFIRLSFTGQLTPTYGHTLLCYGLYTAAQADRQPEGQRRPHLK